ncbi:hypothetical protein V5O48_019208, partial [Marasmius crinis-equi]
DPYNAFMLAARVWRYLHDRLRHGEFYNLNPRVLPHLPSGSMIVRCPTCSDPDMNMEKSWWETTPQWLRHLVMMYTTLDGNSKTRRFCKRGGERDVSLYDGRAQFPLNSEYVKFLERAKKSKIIEPTPDCDSVKVVTRLTDLATHGQPWWLTRASEAWLNQSQIHIPALAISRHLSHRRVKPNYQDH